MASPFALGCCHILHTHLPMVVNHGRWPHGSDWLCEAAFECYLPLLETAHRLVADGISPKWTINLSPVLTEQLASPEFQKELSFYYDNVRRACVEMPRALHARGPEGDRTPDPLLGGILRAHVGAAPAHRRRHPRHVRRPPAGRPRRDHHLRGHARLPAAAVARRVDPPAAPHRGRDAPPPLRAGPPRHLAAGVRLPAALRVDAPDRPRQRPRPAHAARHRGDAGGPRPRVLRRRRPPGRRRPARVPLPRLHPAARQRRSEPAAADAVRARRARPTCPTGSPRAGAPVRRSPSSAIRGPPLQVWSREHGYPGEFAYLEFHKKHFPGGLRFWRITDNQGDLGTKAVVRPRRRGRRRPACRPATSSSWSRTPWPRAKGDGPALVCSPYDSELFGHWWFEGPLWLEHVAREMARGRRAAHDAGRGARGGAARARRSRCPRARGARAATTACGSTATPSGRGTASTAPRPSGSATSRGLRRRRHARAPARAHAGHARAPAAPVLRLAVPHHHRAPRPTTPSGAWPSTTRSSSGCARWRARCGSGEPLSAEAAETLRRLERDDFCFPDLDPAWGLGAPAPQLGDRCRGARACSR